MRIAVCDDQPRERAHLIPLLLEYLAERGLRAEILEYGSGEALVEAFAPGRFELAFLDIYMGKLSGVETARRMKAIDPDCAIIFTTTSREHGADAYDIDAFHYLVKPIDKDKLFRVLGKWYDLLCEIRSVSFKSGRSAREIRIRDIAYVEVLGRSCSVHTQTESIECSLPLAAMEALLPAGEFVRAIRYCLVSLRHISAVRDECVLLDDGKTLPLSRLEKENLRQKLASYRLRRLRGR